MTRDGWFKLGLLLLTSLVVAWLYIGHDEASLWLSTRREARSLLAASRPGPEDSPEGKGPLAFRREGAYDRLLRDGAFGLRIRNEPPKATPVPTVLPTQPPPTAPPLKDLDLQLVGTLVGPSTRYAFLFDRRSKQQDFLTLGDEIHGARIIAIRRNEVDLERAGARTTLKVDFAGEGSAAPPPASTVPTAARKVDPLPDTSPTPPAAGGASSTIQMSRAEINRNLANLQRLSREARLQPYFRRGKLTGFMLSNVRRSSFVERMGARNGDVVQSVDGKPIDSVQKAFSLYNTFRNKNDISITVLRGGRPHTIQYKVR